MDRVAEYESVVDGVRPNGRIGLWGFEDGVAWDIYGSYNVNASDQDYRIGFDLKRYWKSQLDFTKLPHRLINDPLTNLDAAKGGPMVQHTSNDVGINYCPAYQDLNWRNQITVLPLVTLHCDYRNQTRKGTYQGRTMSKCSTCHVVSNIVEMDQEMEEFRTGIDIGNERAMLQYEFVNREIQERAQAPIHVYDEVKHPVNQLHVFTNRVQWEGAQPYNQVPNFKKNTHLLKGRVSITNHGGILIGTYLNDRSDNSVYGYGVTSQISSGYYAISIGDRFRLNMKARDLCMDSDTLLVDVNDTVADGGPQAGKIYKEAYPDYGETDFFQRSYLERNIFDFDIDGTVLLAPKTIFRFGCEFEDLERENFEVERTKTNTFTLGLNTSATESLKSRIKYSYATADSPFLHHHAALPPALQPYPSPNKSPFAGTQYFEIYRAREVDLSNYPKDAHEMLASAIWSPSDRVSLNASLRIKDYSNDELSSLFTWSDNIIAPSVELWVAPSELVDFMAAYTMHRRETDSLFGIAVYDG